MSVGQGDGRNQGSDAANATQENAGCRSDSAELSLASALGDTPGQAIASSQVDSDDAARVSAPRESGVGSAVGPTPPAARTVADAPKADVSQDSHPEVGATRSAASVVMPGQEMPQGPPSQEKGEGDQAAMQPRNLQRSGVGGGSLPCPSSPWPCPSRLGHSSLSGSRAKLTWHGRLRRPMRSIPVGVGRI